MQACRPSLAKLIGQQQQCQSARALFGWALTRTTQEHLRSYPVQACQKMPPVLKTLLWRCTICRQSFMLPANACASRQQSTLPKDSSCCCMNTNEQKSNVWPTVPCCRCPRQPIPTAIASPVKEGIPEALKGCCEQLTCICRCAGIKGGQVSMWRLALVLGG